MQLVTRLVSYSLLGGALASLGCGSPATPGDADGSTPEATGGAAEVGGGSTDAMQSGGETGSTSPGWTDEGTSSSGTDTTGSEGSSSTGPGPSTLRELADDVGMRIGAATKPFELATDPVYASVVAEEFNLITPEYSAKWTPLQPTAGQWFFDELDTLVEHAEAHDQAIKGHALVWYYEVPGWAEALAPAEFQAAVNAHIDATVGRYAGRFWAWDVVNEAIADGLTGNEAPINRLRGGVFLDRLGPGYIANAYHRARAADPDALLVYNDYGIIGPGPKADAVYELLSGLLDEGVPIDAIGFQTHLQLERFPAPDVVRANLRRFAELGLEVHISEMDVSTASLGGDPDDRLDAQRIAFQSIVAVCVTEPSCTTVSVWGVSDDYSWLNTNDNPDIPLLFDAEKVRKPAFDGVWSALQGQGPTEGENIVVNGDFEDGEAAWGVLGGTLSVELGTGTGGSRGARVTDRTEVWMGPSQPLEADFAPFSMWTARAQVRAGGGVHRIAQVLRLGPLDSATYRGVQETVAGDEYIPLSGVFTVPASGFPNDLLMYFEGPPGGVDLYVDDVVIAPL